MREIRSPLAVTFSDPDFVLLQTGLKSDKNPCNEPLAHLTPNFTTENKFSSEDSFPDCHRQSSLYRVRIHINSPNKNDRDKPGHFYLAERERFELSEPLRGSHDFQSCDTVKMCISL